MVSLSHLNTGDRAVICALPEDLEVRKLLMTHGLCVGKEVKLLQSFSIQNLSLLICNGRKIALRREDTTAIQVSPI